MQNNEVVAKYLKWWLQVLTIAHHTAQEVVMDIKAHPTGTEAPRQVTVEHRQVEDTMTLLLQRILQLPLQHQHMEARQLVLPSTQAPLQPQHTGARQLVHQ